MIWEDACLDNFESWIISQNLQSYGAVFEAVGCLAGDTQDQAGGQHQSSGMSTHGEANFKNPHSFVCVEHCSVNSVS